MNDFFRSLRGSFSNERLTRYTGGSDLEIFSKYVHNIERNESFYPCLHLLEVSLRNAIDREMARIYGPTWYETQLAPGDVQYHVDEAKRKISEKRRAVTPGRVISELTFGFWTKTMFQGKYERLWHQIIRNVFPDLINCDRSRDTVSRKLHPIRNLRNRVFHHEPIAHLNLRTLHNDIHTIMNWINKDVGHIAALVDKFPAVQERPTGHYESLLAAKISAICGGTS